MPQPQPKPHPAARIDPVSAEGFHPVALQAAHALGDQAVEARWTPGPANCAVIWLGGKSGGFDSPAQELYPRMIADLAAKGMGGLRIRYRHPGALRECVADALAGAAFLRGRGIRRMGLVGHSFGGAVAAQTAGLTPESHALVLLATQSHGAAAVAHLPHCPVLLVHGQEDGVLPITCSESVFALARHPKRLEIIPGAGHQLDEAAAHLAMSLRAWLDEHLRG